ncbi:MULTISPECIES: hypothetical protein [unclassified Rickettsia]|uniref:hypothetical protein n=1 Tax=unclassified Rickettsia TaxID=114295 RepID=UPI0031332FE1
MCLLAKQRPPGSDNISVVAWLNLTSSLRGGDACVDVKRHCERPKALLHGSNFRCHSYTPLCHSCAGGNPES